VEVVAGEDLLCLLQGDREDCGEVGMTAGRGNEVSGGDVIGRGIRGIEVAGGRRSLYFWWTVRLRKAHSSWTG
jgi:hypothetical protein